MIRKLGKTIVKSGAKITNRELAGHTIKAAVFGTISLVATRVAGRNASVLAKNLDEVIKI